MAHIKQKKMLFIKKLFSFHQMLNQITWCIFV